MNTIKFTKMSRLSTERHNPGDENKQRIQLFNKEYTVSAPINLNILITYDCNCNCDFCIISQEQKLPCVSDQIYLDNLSRILNKLNGLPIEITITGGEPTLCSERLIPTLELIHSYGIPHRTFSTNGSGLLKYVYGKPILQYMKELGAIYNINLSHLHYEESKNKELMLGATINEREMKQISSFCDINGMDIRLSCNLMKSGISCMDEIMEYISFAEQSGFHNMIFRELINYENEFVPIRPIMEQIQENTNFQYLGDVENDHNIIDIYQYQEYIVKLYQSKKTDQLTNLVYREGLLSDSWKTEHFYEV